MPQAGDQSAQPFAQRRRDWHDWTPWLVLACGLLATGLATAFVSWTAREQSELRFTAAVEDATASIASRFEVYRALLRGASGLLAHDDETTRGEFREYIKRLGLSTNYPGIQGIGLSRRVTDTDVPAVLDEARRSGITDFHFWPDSSPDQRHAVVYLEPQDSRNRAALGYNMFSEPTRRAAMEKARDTGRAAATGKVKLVQEIDDKPQAGFLIYLPLYRSNAAPDTVPSRRNNLYGFAYAPFRADDLFQGIFGTHTTRPVEFDAYDGTIIDATNLMHRSSDQVHRNFSRATSSVMDIEGRPWTFVFYATPESEQNNLSTLPSLTAAIGALVTAILFWATLAQRRAHHYTREQERLAASQAALRADIAAALTSPELTTDAMLHRCSDALVRHVPAAFARIWTVASNDPVLVLRASAGLYTHLNGAHSRVPIGQLKIGRIAADGVPHLTNDVQHDPAVSDQAWARREGMVAFAGYPLRANDQVTGVVALFARHPLPSYTLASLAIVADLIAQGLQRRAAEDALRRAQQELQQHASNLERAVADRTRSLEETVSSLESFAYSIAHDLRAPLRTIHSFGSLLETEYGEHLDASGRDFLRRIMAAAGRMDTLITDLLAYNRVSSEEIPIQDVDLDAIVHVVLAQLKADIETRAANVDVRSPLPKVRANATLLNQILSNLIANAVKFVSEGVVPRIQISAERREGFVRISVQDNGIGIEVAHRHRIFGVFERLHPMSKYPGTGIGLAIVRKAVERMRGRIGVESTPGGGSTFWIELPAVE